MLYWDLGSVQFFLGGIDPFSAGSRGYICGAEVQIQAKKLQKPSTMNIHNFERPDVLMVNIEFPSQAQLAGLISVFAHVRHRETRKVPQTSFLALSS